MVTVNSETITIPLKDRRVYKQGALLMNNEPTSEAIDDKEITIQDINKHLLTTAVKGVYQLQKLRIQMGNRVVANFREKYISMFGEPEVKSKDGDEQEKKEKLYAAILGYLKEDYCRITDAIVADFADTKKTIIGLDGDLTPVAKKKLDSVDVYKETALISQRAEYSLVNGYIRTLRTEELQFKDIQRQLEFFPIYTEFLKNVRGCGPAMSGIIIAYFDIHKAIYPSNMIAYCGIDVGPDGRGRGRYKEHLILREYTTREGKAETRLSITFEPFLKTKMLGVLATSFLRSASPYRNAYDNYKHRIESRPVPEGEEPLTKGHIHNMALRYMIKIFLIDLYRKWRELEGLPVAPSYEEAKLGMAPHHQGIVNDIARRM